MSTSQRRWPQELRAQIGLSVPVLLAQISQISMGFVDTVMTGRVSHVDMAAVALASSLWLPVVLFGQGVLLAVTPVTAQLRGAGTPQQAGRILRHGIYLALALTLPLMLLIYFVSFHLMDLGVGERLAQITGAYLRAMVWGGPGYMLFVVMRCGMEGFARVRPAMLAGFVGLAVNIPCNYIFIFGKAGFPAMGGVGAGIASAISCWSLFLVMGLCALRMPDIRGFLAPSAWERPQRAILLKLLSIGFPGALAMLVEVSSFATMALFIAPLGASVVAGHQVALNFSSILFMFPLSISMAATIRVGYGLGIPSAAAVRTATRVAMGLGLTVSLLTAGGTILARESIGLMYNNDPGVVALASSLLLFAACYQCVDALQIIGIGILRGYNDTRAIFRVTLFAYWVVALPLGYVLGRTDLLVAAMGAQGFWIASVVGLTLAAGLYIRRLLKLERRPLPVVSSA